MPRPIAICIEDLAYQAPDRRYLRCTALAGSERGVLVDAAGQVLWQASSSPCLELCVSLDDRLILFRPVGGPPATLHRGGRSLDIPEGKPVFVLDGDELVLGERRLRLHVHGEAPAISAPSYLDLEEGEGSEGSGGAANATDGAGEHPDGARGFVARAAAAALAIGAALGLGGCKPNIEVREHPPVVAEVPPPPDARPAGPDRGPDLGADLGPDRSGARPPIEVRERPPKMAPLPKPDAAPPKPDVKRPPPIEVRPAPPMIAIPKPPPAPPAPPEKQGKDKQADKK